MDAGASGESWLRRFRDPRTFVRLLREALVIAFALYVPHIGVYGHVLVPQLDVIHLWTDLGFRAERLVPAV